MSAFEKWKARFLERRLQSWSEWAPAGLKHMTREEAAEGYKYAALVGEMPEAELTPEMLLLRNFSQESEREAYEHFMQFGRLLLQAKERHTDEQEFWHYLETKLEWKGSREDAILAMEAVLEKG